MSGNKTKAANRAVANSQQEQAASRWNATTISTVVIAFATLVNLAVSIGMWLVTRDYTAIARDNYAAEARPYLTLIEPMCQNTPAQHQLAVSINWKNVSNFPAIGVEKQFGYTVNGAPQLMAELPNGPTIYGPQQSFSFPIIFRADAYDRLMAGADEMEVNVSFTYHSLAGGTYHMSEKARYNPELNSFAELTGNAD